MADEETTKQKNDEATTKKEDGCCLPVLYDILDEESSPSSSSSSSLTVQLPETALQRQLNHRPVGAFAIRPGRRPYRFPTLSRGQRQPQQQAMDNSITTITIDDDDDDQSENASSDDDDDSVTVDGTTSFHVVPVAELVPVNNNNSICNAIVRYPDIEIAQEVYPGVPMVTERGGSGDDNANEDENTIVNFGEENHDDYYRRKKKKVEDDDDSAQQRPTKIQPVFCKFWLVLLFAIIIALLVLVTVYNKSQRSSHGNKSTFNKTLDSPRTTNDNDKMGVSPSSSSNETLYDDPYDSYDGPPFSEKNKGDDGPR